jgi:hypothetical protein
MSGCTPPPGVYLLNTFALFRGAGNLFQRITENFANVAIVGWFPDFKLFGADPGFAVTVPFASNYTTGNYSNAGPTGLPQRVSLAGEIASIADTEYSAILGWHAGVHHWNVILTGFARTGNMLSDHLALTGLNRPALDLKGAYTYDAAMVALAYATPVIRWPTRSIRPSLLISIWIGLPKRAASFAFGR